MFKRLILCVALVACGGDDEQVVYLDSPLCPESPPLTEDSCYSLLWDILPDGTCVMVSPCESP